MTKTQVEIWNDVYSKGNNSYPWTGIPFSNDALKFLDQIDKEEKLIIVGCGTGETVDTISKLGFKRVVGTDISQVAISRAKERYANDFIVTSTEELHNQRDLVNSNLFDWLNLHQINPENVVDYVNSICNVSNNICISWIYQNEQNMIRKSYVHDYFIYFHEPKFVQSIFMKNGFNLNYQSSFEFASNFEVKKVIHSAITQIYEKR